MRMQGHPASLVNAHEGRARAGDAVAIEPVDVDAILESLPWNLVLPLGDIEKVVKLKPLAGRSLLGVVWR
jgi:hypothetical protein